MRGLIAAMVALGSLAVSCTGHGVVVHPHPSPSAVPSVVVHIAKPQNITVSQAASNYDFVVKPKDNPPAEYWARGVLESAGALCARLRPPGFHYSFSDVSDAGLIVAITCVADGSQHNVHVIFTPESGS